MRDGGSVLIVNGLHGENGGIVIRLARKESRCDAEVKTQQPAGVGMTAQEVTSMGEYVTLVSAV